MRGEFDGEHRPAYASTTTLAAIRAAGPCESGWRKLCECGCGRVAPIAAKTDARDGAIKGQPLRFISGHNRRGTADLTRFDIVEAGFGTPCWNWTGSVNRKGYGRCHVNGVHKNAHRAVYEAAVGEIDPGLHLDHLCRNRLCVNPDHMEPISPAENNRRKASAAQERPAPIDA